MTIRNRTFIRGFAVGVTATVMMVVFKITPGFGAVIVEQGKPNAAIIVSDDAPDSVRLAASELQGYVEKVTGARLPVQKEPIPKGRPGVNLFLGESQFTKTLGLNLDGLKSDGFKIVSRDNWLAILGRDYRGAPIFGLMNPWQYNEVYSPKLKIGAFGEIGTLYGVYRFLEDYCGVRWYLPGDFGTVIPKMETIRVEEVNYQKSPDFEYRYSWFCDFDQSDEDALWYRRAGFGAAYPVQIVHSFWFFAQGHCGIGPYKDTHPEYFALIDGKRDFSNLSCIAGGGNLCLSNPDVAKQWVADINDYFDKNPQQFIFPLMPNDGMMKICECEQCQSQVDLSPGSGKFSNYVWGFINIVAKEVYKTHPAKIIGCCAYESYSVPPANIKKLNANVAVMICKMRSSYHDKQSQERMNKIIAAWREKANNVYLWEYYRFSVEGWRGLPVVYPHIISADLRFLKGVTKGEFIEEESWPPELGQAPCQIITCPGMQHVNLYVTAKLLWDSSLDVDKLMNEYYAKFYGPAGEEMKGFWTTAEEIWMTACPPAEQNRADWRNPVNIYTKDKLDKLSAFLKKAQLKTPENSVYRERIELINAEFLPARRKLSNVLVLNPPDIAVAGPTSAIQVDGVLDEAAWRKIAPMPFVDKDGEDAKYKTLAYTAWDNDCLYFAFINYEPEISALTALATERDQSYAPAIWDDDSVEIYICPNPDDRAKCYQLIVNAKGTIWDGVHNPETPGGIDAKWNSGSDAKTKIEANRWIVEMKVPLKAIGITSPAAGKKIAVNLYRNRHCGQPVVFSCWSPTIEPAHFTPARFGQITFK